MSTKVSTSMNARPHGFIWPSGLPLCAMCGRAANEQIHVTPHRGAGSILPLTIHMGGQYALDRSTPNLPAQAHGFMLASPGLTKNIACQACGQPIGNGIHTVGLPAGSMPISSNSGLYGSGLTSTFASQRAFVAEIGQRLVLAAPVTTDFTAEHLPREVAAAWEQAQQDNPYYMWIAGRYVEADRPNRNAAYWSTADLEVGQPTVTHGPINWLHEEKHIIGSIAGSKMVHVDKQMADESGVGNHIVMLGALWSHIYPAESAIIKAASDNGKLYASMECVSQSVACLTCDKSMGYGDYMRQEARCEHMRAGAPRRFVDPTFGGAGIIVPPVRPGWANADIKVQAAAEELAERQAAAFGGLTFQEARETVAQILTWVESVAEVETVK